MHLRPITRFTIGFDPCFNSFITFTSFQTVEEDALRRGPPPQQPALAPPPRRTDQRDTIRRSTRAAARAMRDAAEENLVSGEDDVCHT